MLFTSFEICPWDSEPSIYAESFPEAAVFVKRAQEFLGLKLRIVPAFEYFRIDRLVISEHNASIHVTVTGARVWPWPEDNLIFSKELEFDWLHRNDFFSNRPDIVELTQDTQTNGQISNNDLDDEESSENLEDEDDGDWYDYEEEMAYLRWQEWTDTNDNEYWERYREDSGGFVGPIFGIWPYD